MRFFQNSHGIKKRTLNEPLPENLLLSVRELKHRMATCGKILKHLVNFSLHCSIFILYNYLRNERLYILRQIF